MLGYSQLFEQLDRSPARSWLRTLPDDIAAALSPVRNRNLEQWQETVAELPDVIPSEIDLQAGIRIGCSEDIDPATRERLIERLKILHPWRKGPFDLFGIHIDTEWRSDWKWERVLPHLQSLKGRRVLDVGCGNGYYALRMWGAGAELVVGIDPSAVFVMQFAALLRYLPEPNVYVLPLGIEQLPSRLLTFDTVFSMGGPLPSSRPPRTSGKANRGLDTGRRTSVRNSGTRHGRRSRPDSTKRLCPNA